MNKQEWLKAQEGRKIIGQHTSIPRIEILKGVGVGYDMNIAYQLNFICEVHIIMLFCFKIGWTKTTIYSDIDDCSIDGLADLQSDDE